MKWLLSNDEFYFAIDNNEWLWDVFSDNGITCEDAAISQLTYACTGYDIPDCPYCGFNDNRQYKLSTNQWKCKKCLNKYSFTSRRYLENTKLPLTHWWKFAWIIAKNEKLNSCAISRELGITQKSAWQMIAVLKNCLHDKKVQMKNSCLGFKNHHEVLKLLMSVKNEYQTLTTLTI